MIYLLLTGRYLVAFVLFAAGVSKVRDRVHGVEVVERYGILPRWSVPAVAALLPWCEVVLAVGLAAGIQPSLAGLLACALFVQFAAAIAWNVRKGKRFDCGCGIAEGPIGWDLVGRNILLGLIAAAVGDGPATGLSLWTGWTARTWSVPSAGNLIPVPLIVVIAIAAARCAQTGWMAWRTPPTRALRDQ